MSHVPRLLEEVGGAVPELAGHHRGVDEADRQREEDPAGHCHQQQQLSRLEPARGIQAPARYR